MKTFRIRFRFHLAQKGKIKGEGKDFQFTLPNGHSAKLICLDSDEFKECKKFAVTSGGYQSEGEALEFAIEIKEAVLSYGTKFRTGLDPGNDKSRSFFSDHYKKEIFKEHGVVVIDDVHGIMVHSEEFPTSYASASGTGIVNPKDKEFFADEVCKILSSPRKVNEKIRLSMELLNASHFESSPRSRFLTLVLSAEALLEPDDRSDKAQRIVDDIINTTISSDLEEYEKKSILGTLKYLKKESLTQSLRKMASTHLHDKKYGGLSSEKFIKKCYDARSKLVHKGKVDESKHNIGSLAANLEVYMTDMLVNISQI